LPAPIAGTREFQEQPADVAAGKAEERLNGGRGEIAAGPREEDIVESLADPFVRPMQDRRGLLVLADARELPQMATGEDEQAVVSVLDEGGLGGGVAGLEAGQ
jgi:hypothetical protein